MNIIRKISIGSSYKSDAMHYNIGQNVYGGHCIKHIVEKEGSYEIYIQKDDEMLLWKSFNQNMAVAVEYDLEY